MRVVAFDLETHLITDSCKYPKPICLSTCDGRNTWLYSGPGILEEARRLLSDDNVFLLGHNSSAFDLPVLALHYPELLALIFEKLQKRLVGDTLLRAALFHLRLGIKTEGLRLDFLAKRYLNLEVAKGEDTWRLRYSELENVPLQDWPEEAVFYAKNDSDVTLRLWKKLPRSPDEWLQNQAAFSLALITSTGLIADKGKVYRLKQHYMEEYTRLELELIAHGVLREKFTKKKATGEVVRTVHVNTDVVKRYVEDFFGKQDVPRTKKGAVQASREVLNRIIEESEAMGLELVPYVRYTEIKKLITAFIPVLEKAAESSIHPRYNTLVATGRTSCYGPNTQQIPRLPGVRDCFIPRPGTAFVACDYDTLELRSFADVCKRLVGFSTMGAEINKGSDLHLALAAKLTRKTYDEAKALLKQGDKEIKDARQISKQLNFGLPGGMGYKRLQAALKQNKIEVDLEEAKSLRNTWLSQWTEADFYFKFIESLGEPCTVTLPWSGRSRGRTKYSAACNSFFQGTAADGAKLALFEVSRRAYSVPESKLFGSRVVNFIHDEIMLESPLDKAAEAALELQDVMNEEMARVITTVKITSSAHLMKFWSKNACEVYDDRGRLVPWPKELLLPGPRYKETQSGSSESVKKIGACEHEWEFVGGQHLLDSIRVWWRCGICETFRR